MYIVIISQLCHGLLRVFHLKLGLDVRLHSKKELSSTK